MAWLLLVVAGAFEVAFAVSLKSSEGFTRLIPSVLAMGAGGISFLLLNLALRTMAVGTAYAVWTGLGAVGTVAVGIIALGEPATVGRLASMGLVIFGIIGLKLYDK